MLKRRQLSTYNDGLLQVFRKRTAPTSFGAATNARHREDLEPVCRLAYRAAAIRGQDFDFAEQIGFACSAKLVCHDVVAVKPGMVALVNGTLYAIRHIDRTQREMYLYLEGGETFVDA